MSASDMTSKINLVDLAGSERQDKTGASGQRLKEGSAINQAWASVRNQNGACADRGVSIDYLPSIPPSSFPILSLREEPIQPTLPGE